MRYGVDFTVEPIPKRCQGHKQTVKPSQAIKYVMDPELETKKSFKNCVEIRNYWADHKRAQRQRAKEKQSARGQS